jgi:hypothetical protein
MDCEMIQPDLAPYHFGVVAQDVRAAVETHLLGCRACLGAFFSLKHAIETAPELGPRPSETARARLRQEAGLALDRLAAAHAEAPARRRWRTGAGLVLAAAGAAALGLLALRGQDAAPPAGALHDSARPSAESGRVL